ncbi:MAG TPA: hypothetical protein VGR43_05825 [Dehalococcoidia bacterium]|nr:hypothetical protein [Dehalococcoidia bacterium]
MAPISKPELTLAADEARQFFLDKLRDLPGVVKAEMRGNQTRSEPTFVVYIPEDDIETEMSVYDLKLETYQRFPDARLDVWIEEVDPVQAQSPLAPDMQSSG